MCGAHFPPRVLALVGRVAAPPKRLWEESEDEKEAPGEAVNGLAIPVDAARLRELDAREIYQRSTEPLPFAVRDLEPHYPQPGPAG